MYDDRALVGAGVNGRDGYHVAVGRHSRSRDRHQDWVAAVVDVEALGREIVADGRYVIVAVHHADVLRLVERSLIAEHIEAVVNAAVVHGPRRRVEIVVKRKVGACGHVVEAGAIAPVDAAHVEQLGAVGCEPHALVGEVAPCAEPSRLAGLHVPDNRPAHVAAVWVVGPPGSLLAVGRDGVDGAAGRAELAVELAVVPYRGHPKAVGVVGGAAYPLAVGAYGHRVAAGCGAVGHRLEGVPLVVLVVAYVSHRCAVGRECEVGELAGHGAVVGHAVGRRHGCVGGEELALVGLKVPTEAVAVGIAVGENAHSPLAVGRDVQHLVVLQPVEAEDAGVALGICPGGHRREQGKR